MAGQSNIADGGAEAGAYRCTGSITIARAASTQRELDAAPDPLTIDLSGVSKMDTVGAWLIYRATRDRGARVVGASADVKGLLKQVAEADHPAKVRPEEPSSTVRILREIGEWVTESGNTMVGLVGFLGAVLVAFATIVR
ncbi:MAG: lipid asymmetry maintenance protein MlaB, partial [Sphingomicrobium sp.]